MLEEMKHTLTVDCQSSRQKCSDPEVEGRHLLLL